MARSGSTRSPSPNWRLPAGVVRLGEMSQWRAPLLTLVLSAVAVAGVLGYRHLESTSGQTATTIQLSRLDGPGTGRLADWHGTPVVVNLFASWCPACLRHMPAFYG